MNIAYLKQKKPQTKPPKNKNLPQEGSFDLWEGVCWGAFWDFWSVFVCLDFFFFGGRSLVGFFKH